MPCIYIDDSSITHYRELYKIVEKHNVGEKIIRNALMYEKTIFLIDNQIIKSMVLDGDIFHISNRIF